MYTVYCTLSKRIPYCMLYTVLYPNEYPTVYCIQYAYGSEAEGRRTVDKYCITTNCEDNPVCLDWTRLDLTGQDHDEGGG